MYLKKTPTKSGKTSLSIVKGFRDEAGRTRQRTVKTIGFLEDLVDEYEDPIAHFTQLAREMTEAERDKAASLTLSIHPAQKIDMRSASRKNVGCAAALRIYNSLGIEAALRNHGAKSKSGYDLNAVMRLLVVERLLHPCSKLSAHSCKDSYFFRSAFTEDDLYRALDELARAKDKLVSASNKRIENAFGRDTKNVFYDVTNYYFECDADGLRAQGASKEHRPNPIIQMGLLQDACGVPITYKLFAGNTVDCQTMLPVLADLKRGLSLPSVTAVADKGLNSSANMAALIASGDGFVFSQSIRGTKSDRALRARVLDGRGYRANEEGTFKKKSWQGTKTVHLKANETASGKAEDVEIDVKYVAFWSRKYAERARCMREKAIDRALKLVDSKAAYARATRFGAAKYVKALEVDAESGELVEGRSVRALDTEAIEKDAQADGYHLIVTSRTNWSDDEIIEAYRGLWRIEESFRITKSDIKARPVYVRTPAHIEAHFLTCYIALVILRLLQKLCPSRPSAAKITEALSGLSCSKIEDNRWLFDYRSKLTEELFCAVGLDHPTKYMQTSQIKKLMQKKKISQRQ